MDIFSITCLVGFLTAVTSLMSVVSTVMTTITGNETLMVFFCAGVVGIAIGVVKKLRTR